MTDPIACRLPAEDRAQRTADFRALFAGALVGRERLPGLVVWSLRRTVRVEDESRRLAALEARCCDGIRFDVRATDGDLVEWRITGTAAASATLDALYELPAVIGTDAGAADVWQRLSDGGCGPQRGASPP